MAIEEILTAAGASTAGNIAGSIFNKNINLDLMNQQMENEKELQRSAYALNEQAQQNQGSIMKHSLENAGLNPATATAQGAPSLQAGSAAGANSQLANIFTGVADLINAAKAPTEIEKATAEKELAEAGAKKATAEISAIQEQTKNVIQDTKKLAEETQGAKNINDVFKAQQNFMKDYGAAIFDGYRSILQTTKHWENLPYKTRSTIDSLADGYIELDIGSLEALNNIIDSQANLTERDKKTIHNVLDTIVDLRQLNNESVLKSYETMPHTQKRLLMAETNNFYEEAKKAKTEADLNKLDKWLKEHTSDEYLIEHGMSDELERRKYKELFNRILNLPFNIMENGAPAAIMGSAMQGTKRMELNSKTNAGDKPKIWTPDSKGSFTINGNTWR